MTVRWSGVCVLGVGLCSEWWACVWRGAVCRSEKHHRELTGALRLTSWLPGTVFTGLLMGLHTRAHPQSALLHLPAQGPGTPTSNRAQGRHMLRSQRYSDPPLVTFQSPASNGTCAPSPLPPALKAEALSFPDAKPPFIYMWESQKEVVVGFLFRFPKEPFWIFLQLILY